MGFIQLEAYLYLRYAARQWCQCVEPQFGGIFAGTALMPAEKEAYAPIEAKDGKGLADKGRQFNGQWPYPKNLIAQKVISSI
jgi:hypothetical protein